MVYPSFPPPHHPLPFDGLNLTPSTNVNCVSVQSRRRIPEWGYTMRHKHLVPWSGCLPLWDPGAYQKRKSGYFNSNGQLLKVYGILFRTGHNFHSGI